MREWLLEDDVICMDNEDFLWSSILFISQL